MKKMSQTPLIIMFLALPFSSPNNIKMKVGNISAEKENYTNANLPTLDMLYLHQLRIIAYLTK